MKMADTEMKPTKVEKTSAVGTFIRARRQERDLTQKELARFAQVSYTLVNRVENGDMNVQAGSLNKLLGVFGYQIGPQRIERPDEVETDG